MQLLRVLISSGAAAPISQPNCSAGLVRALSQRPLSAPAPPFSLRTARSVATPDASMPLLARTLNGPISYWLQPSVHYSSSECGGFPHGGLFLARAGFGFRELLVTVEDDAPGDLEALSTDAAAAAGPMPNCARRYSKRALREVIEGAE